jgi:hypothetical protein
MTDEADTDWSGSAGPVGEGTEFTARVGKVLVERISDGSTKVSTAAAAVVTGTYGGSMRQGGRGT